MKEIGYIYKYRKSCIKCRTSWTLEETYPSFRVQVLDPFQVLSSSWEPDQRREKVVGERGRDERESENVGSSSSIKTKLTGPQKKTTIKKKQSTSVFTLIWYTGCILFCMQSSTIFLTCFKPLNEPIAATVLPYTFNIKWSKKSIHDSPLCPKGCEVQ